MKSAVQAAFEDIWIASWMASCLFPSRFWAEARQLRGIGSKSIEGLVSLAETFRWESWKRRLRAVGCGCGLRAR